MISIIIIVKNDLGISDTLNKLSAINKPEKTEIIVVDASNGTLSKIKIKYPNIKWINYINHNSKKITIPEQRNVGIKNAKGEKIVFIDANCIPEDQWLNKLYNTFVKDNEFVVAGQAKQYDGKEYFNNEIVKTKYINQCPTINVMINKHIFKVIGLFDERYNYGSDVDFSWRVIEKNYKIRYVKDAIVYHNWGNLKINLKRAFRYGEARARLYKLRKERVSYILQRDSTLVFYIFYIILFIIILFFPIYFILYFLILFILIIKNIQKKPFQVIGFNFIFAIGAIKEIITI